MYSIIIPITKYIKLLNNQNPSKKEHNNFTRFFEICWPFHLKNLYWNDIHTIFFVISSTYINEFQTLFDSSIKPESKTKFVIMNEEDILGIESSTIGNTRKQMMIKLLISFYVKTRTYLTLDDDIFTLNPVKEEHFYNNKKIAIQSTSKDVHEQWWKGSSHMLRIPYNPTLLDKLSKDNLLMDVTPEILHTNTARSLCRHLESLHGKDFINIFITKNIEHRWSEYTLYWIYITHVKKTMRRLYTNHRVPLNNAIWDHSNNKKVLEEYIQKICNDNKSFFATIPGNIKRNRTSLIIQLLNRNNCKPS